MTIFRFRCCGSLVALLGMAVFAFTGCAGEQSEVGKIAVRRQNALPISRAEFVSLKETLIAPPFVTEVVELLPEGAAVSEGLEIARLSPGERLQGLKEKQAELEKLNISVERDRRLLELAGQNEEKSTRLVRVELDKKLIEFDRAVESRDWLRLLELRESGRAGKVRQAMLQKQLDASRKMADRGFVAKQELADNEKELQVEKLNASLTLRLTGYVDEFPDAKKVFEAAEALEKAELANELASFSTQKNLADYRFNLNDSLRKYAQIASSVHDLEAELASLTIRAPRAGVLLYGDTYDGAVILKLRTGAQVYPGLNFLKIVDSLQCGFSFALDQRDVLAVASITSFAFRPDALPELLLVGRVQNQVPVALEIPQAKPDGRTQVVFKAGVASYPPEFLIGYSGTVFCGDIMGEMRARFRGNRRHTVTRKPMRRIMSTSGDVKPASASFIVADLEGKLSEVAEEGKSVKAGDQIAVIDCEELMQSARDTEIELNKKNEEYQLQLQKNRIDAEKTARGLEVRSGALEVARLKHAALLKSRDEDQIIDLKRSLEVLAARIALAREKIVHVGELRKKGLSSELEVLQCESELATLQKDQKIAEYKLKLEESGPTDRSVRLSELDVLKAELEKEKAELDGAINNLRNEMTSRLLEAEISRLKVSLDRSNTQIESARIKAPADGVIILNEYNKASGGMGKARVGDNVYWRIPFMQVANVSNLHVHCTVSEMDAKFIKPGDEVKLILKGNSVNKNLRGWVNSVGIVATTEFSKRQDAVVTVVISMTSPQTGKIESDPAFRPGTTCEVEFKLYDVADALHLPYDGLLPTATASCVVTRAGDIRPIELLFSDGLRGCAIKTGLGEGDEILLMEAADD